MALAEGRLFAVLLFAAMAEARLFAVLFFAALAEARLFAVLFFAALAETRFFAVLSLALAEARLFFAALAETRPFAVLFFVALAEARRFVVPFLGALAEARLFVMLLLALAEARFFAVLFFAALAEAGLFVVLFAALAEARLFAALFVAARRFVVLVAALAESGLFVVLLRVFAALTRFVDPAARAFVAFVWPVPAAVAARVFVRLGSPARDGLVPASCAPVSRFVPGGFVSVRIPSCSAAAPRFPFDAPARSALVVPARRRFLRRSAKRNPFTALTMLPAAPRAPSPLVVRPFFLVLGGRSSSAAGTKPMLSSSGIVLRPSSRPSMLCLV